MIFAGCQTTEIKADIIAADDILFTENAYVYDPETDPNWVYGAIITPNEYSEVFPHINNKETYTTVVILASTEYKTENENIFTYSKPGALANIEMDEETMTKLIKSDFLHDLGEISENSYWNNQVVENIGENFPDAEFILISVNKDIYPEVIGYALKSNLPKESIVFTVAEYEEYTSNKLIQEFQQNFTKEVINNFDQAHFKDLPLKNSIQLEIFAKYIRLKKAHKIEPIGDKQAIFKKGDRTPYDGTTTTYMVTFGDIMLGRYVRTLMDANGLDYPFKKMNESYLKNNDILLANLEGPITKNSVRTTTGMSFGFFPDTGPLLKKYHFDALSQANNHAFDKREASYEESLEHLNQQGIVPFGSTYDINDGSIGRMYVRGQKIAFVGLEDVNSKIDDTKALKIIEELTKDDFRVIVYPHWGTEYRHQPNKRQVDLAHAFIDAGAYMVIGHHPHVVQTYENYKGRPIIYSLGNAIFDQYWSAPTQEGLSIALAMNDKSVTIYLLPITLRNSQMELLNQEESTNFYDKFITWGNYSEDEKNMIKSGKITLTF